MKRGKRGVGGASGIEKEACGFCGLWRGKIVNLKHEIKNNEMEVIGSAQKRRLKMQFRR